MRESLKEGDYCSCDIMLNQRPLPAPPDSLSVPPPSAACPSSITTACLGPQSRELQVPSGCGISPFLIRVLRAADASRPGGSRVESLTCGQRPLLGQRRTRAELPLENGCGSCVCAPFVSKQEAVLKRSFPTFSDQLGLSDHTMPRGLTKSQKIDLTKMSMQEGERENRMM